jgi:ribosomal subunit interface protein
MATTNFPIEFNNEVDDVKKSENEFFTVAVDRLSELEKGHTDILNAAVNFKQPSQGRETAHIFEVTIVVYMVESNSIVATEKGENFRATLDGALDAVERQIHQHREQQRNY